MSCSGCRRARRLTGGFVNAGQRHGCHHRECGGKAESGRGANPADQDAAERRAAGKGDGARELNPRIGRRQLLRGHERGHQRRCGDAVDDGAAHRDEAEQREQRKIDGAGPDQQQDRRQCGRAQRFGAGHQEAPGHPVGEQAGRDREQDEGQRQRGLQQAGLAFADAEQQHRDDGGRGQRDLLGRLGRQIRPGEAVEGRGQVNRLGSGHGAFPKLWVAGILRRHDGRTHPLPDNTIWGTFAALMAGSAFPGAPPWLDAVANELQ